MRINRFPNIKVPNPANTSSYLLLLRIKEYHAFQRLYFTVCLPEDPGLTASAVSNLWRGFAYHMQHVEYHDKYQNFEIIGQVIEIKPRSMGHIIWSIWYAAYDMTYHEKDYGHIIFRLCDAFNRSDLILISSDLILSLYQLRWMIQYHWYYCKDKNEYCLSSEGTSYLSNRSDE